MRLTADEVYKKTESDINESRTITHKMMELGLIKRPPMEMMESCVKRAVAMVKEESKS